MSRFYKSTNCPFTESHYTGRDFSAVTVTVTVKTIQSTLTKAVSRWKMKQYPYLFSPIGQSHIQIQQYIK